MCGSADPTVAIVALLHAMAAVLTESAKQEADQVPYGTFRNLSNGAKFASCFRFLRSKQAGRVGNVFAWTSRFSCCCLSLEVCVEEDIGGDIMGNEA